MAEEEPVSVVVACGYIICLHTCYSCTDYQACDGPGRSCVPMRGRELSMANTNVVISAIQSVKSVATLHIYSTAMVWESKKDVNFFTGHTFCILLAYIHV